MKNIKEFESKDELKIYFKKNAIKKIGEASEGKVYLTRDNEIIKGMWGSFVPKHYKDYPDIIMADDVKLDSFIFPKELFLYKGIIIGYRQDYFKGNIFKFDSLDRVNLDKLVKARERFIEDTKVITDSGYHLFELPRNLLFNNERLVAIDTLDYVKRDDITLKENIETIDYALLLPFSDIYKEVNPSKPFEEEIKKVYELRK